MYSAALNQVPVEKLALGGTKEKECDRQALGGTAGGSAFRALERASTASHVPCLKRRR